MHNNLIKINMYNYGYFLQIIEYYYEPNLDPLYVIYMGKDKYENEILLRYGFPIDVWFHVDNLSSAHVYLRLPENVTYETIDKVVLEECCQIVKDNSIEGCKKDKVIVCYTPYENLLKTGEMEIGAVTFKKKDQVKYVPCIKNKDILKVINKTYLETIVDHEGISSVKLVEKENYLKEQRLKQKKIYEENV